MEVHNIGSGSQASGGMQLEQKSNRLFHHTGSPPYPMSCFSLVPSLPNTSNSSSPKPCLACVPTLSYLSFFFGGGLLC